MQAFALIRPHTLAAARQRVLAQPEARLLRALAVDGGTDTWLLPRDPPNAATLPDELLSVDLVCSNRGLPLRLGVGDLQGAPPGALFRSYQNITPITPPIHAPLGEDAQWQMLAHLGLAARGLHDPAALRALLSLHNAPARLHTATGRSNARQIEAIRDAALKGDAKFGIESMKSGDAHKARKKLDAHAERLLNQVESFVTTLDDTATESNRGLFTGLLALGLILAALGIAGSIVLVRQILSPIDHLSLIHISEPTRPY